MHAQQTKAAHTLKTYKCTHGAASTKPRVSQLPSLKEDTAVEHGGREREGERERAGVVVRAGLSEGELARERERGGKSWIPEDLD